MRKYKAYHTSIKSCFALGIEDAVLPASFIDSISHSTAYYWKKDQPEKYVGYEFASQIESNFDDVHTILDERIRLFKKSFIAFARLYLMILDSIGQVDFQKMIRQNKYILVDLIDNLSKALNNKKVTHSMCKFLRITPKMFNAWKDYRQYTCDKSMVNICFKRLPQQVSIAD